MTVDFAPDPQTVQNLAGLVDLPEQGTVFTAVVHKMGVERGEAASKVVYGDDTIRVLIWTGFSYRALIARSMRILDHQLSKGGYIRKLAKTTLEAHSNTTLEDVCAALQEVRESFRLKLATREGEPADMPTEGTWTPLVINGTVVRGCVVYTGPAREGPRAPVPGTIYVRGLKLGERLVKPSPNGSWTPDSKPKTLAKQIIMESLPVGLYCQYRLEPGRVSDVAVADAAVMVAKEHQINIDPGALTNIFKAG